MHLRHFIGLPLLSLAWACGGQSLNDPDNGDSGAGGDSGKGGSSGAGAIGGSGTCLAFPTCGPDETQVSGPEYCVAGGVCHQVSICGATIWCTGKAACDAVPVCDVGDTQVSGACSPDVSCYTRSLCDTTVWCLDRCNPATEPNRAYLLATCAPGDGWTCPLNTTSFVNECGCGCEQDPSCPSSFYCSGLPARTLPMPAPGGAGTSGGQSPVPLPYCDPAELARCPYSEVVP